MCNQCKNKKKKKKKKTPLISFRMGMVMVNLKM